MERKFAPPDDRLRSLIAREKQMPALLDRGPRQSQEPAAHLHRDRHRAVARHHQLLSSTTCRSAFADAKDPALKAEFAQTNAAVIAALKSYLDWLKTDLLPSSNGDFRIGADTFSEKACSTTRWSISRSTSCSKSAGPTCTRIRSTSSRSRTSSSPDKDPRAVLEELGEDHPAPDQLLDAFRATFDSLIAFIHSHHIVTIPSDVRPILEETPPFMRATTFASMDTPGPFETHATEAYFNVTLPDPSMTPAEVEGYMHCIQHRHRHLDRGARGLSRPLRAVPVGAAGAQQRAQAARRQYQRRRLGPLLRADDARRRATASPASGAKDEREAKFLRLGQLQDALLRNARFIVGIQMHTGKMTIEQADEFFQKEGYQSKETAVVETKRGTGDPTYLYYTLGKLEIMKLREDLKKKAGRGLLDSKSSTTIFCKQGFPPIKIVREAMLGDNSPTL